MTDVLYCDGQQLDINSAVAIPFNYSIADVKEPSKRKRNFSKDIVLPGTATNMLFFQGAYSFTVTDGSINFDPTIKRSSYLEKNGLRVIDGVMQLVSVSLDDKYYSFTVRIFSETVDIFLLLSQININELDWSDYDHTLTRPNIKASWLTADGTGYYYPLIERGNGRVGTIWKTVDFVPYVFLYECVKKMFEYVGFTIDSNFIESSLFKKILFGYGGGAIGQLSPTEIANRRVNYTDGTFNQQPSTSLVLGNPNRTFYQPYSLTNGYTVTEVTDAYNQLTGGELTIINSGGYNISTAGTIAYSFANQLLALFVTQHTFQLLKNGIVIQQQQLFTTAQSGSISVGLAWSGTLSTGDVLELRYLCSGVEHPTSVVNTLTISSSNIAFDLQCTDTSINDGSLIQLSRFIPNMKCSELLLGVIRHFNLYVSEPSYEGVVRIEPLSDYYSQTDTFVDISERVDLSKEINIKPSANEYGKEIVYKFKEITDFDALEYRSKWGLNYGDLAFEQSSYYAKGQQVTELPYGTIVPYQIQNNIVIPRFVKQDSAGVLTENASAPRVMFKVGLQNGTWDLKDNIGLGSETLTTYPSVHHFDDYLNPFQDLNFGLVKEIYYSSANITTRNSYSEYNSQFVLELINPAGQFVTLYVYWNETDIHDLDFSKLIMYNGALFRLNTVTDYDSNKVATTKIELVKIISASKKRVREIVKPISQPTKPIIKQPINLGGFVIIEQPFKASSQDSVIFNI